VAFKINITTQESISTFARFIGLIEWITGGRPQKFDYWDRPRWYGKTLRISLNFDLDVHTPLEDLRFEVTDLVFNSFSLSPETSLLVQQPLHGGKTCTRPVERGCSTLYRLRRALLVFLSEIMASHQGLEPGPFPQVWADGKLRPREASFTLTNGGTKIVTNKKYLLLSNQLNKEKNPALSRLAPQKVDHEWESCSCSYPCYGPRASQDGTELYETVLSGTSFLAGSSSRASTRRLTECPDAALGGRRCMNRSDRVAGCFAVMRRVGRTCASSGRTSEMIGVAYDQDFGVVISAEYGWYSESRSWSQLEEL
jgi:hypothetical protein